MNLDPRTYAKRSICPSHKLRFMRSLDFCKIPSSRKNHFQIPANPIVNTSADDVPRNEPPGLPQVSTSSVIFDAFMRQHDAHFQTRNVTRHTQRSADEHARANMRAPPAPPSHPFAKAERGGARPPTLRGGRAPTVGARARARARARAKYPGSFQHL